MSETTTLEFDPRAKRGELEELAINNGLVSAKTYANKPAVIEALEKVQAGGDAGEIDAEYKQEVDNADDASQNSDSTTPPDVTVTDNDDEPTSDDKAPETAPNEPTKPKGTFKNRNQGHPTAFDANGRPMFR